MIIFLLISSLSIHGKDCRNEQAIDSFFERLESNNTVNELKDIVFYGRDLKSGNIYKLVFDRSDLFSALPGEFKFGSFIIKSSDHRFHGGENIVGGGLFDNYSKYGKIKSPFYAKYLESKMSKNERAKFYYNRQGDFIKFSYVDKQLSIKIVFYPSQEIALKEAY